MTTPLNLDELERLEQAGTPGAWRADYDGCLVWGPRNEHISDMRGVGAGLPMEENAALIAAARNALPAMIARIRELEAEQKTATERLEAIAAPLSCHPTLDSIAEASSEVIRDYGTLEHEADDLKARIRELEGQARWVPVSEQLPALGDNPSRQVLLCSAQRGTAPYFTREQLVSVQSLHDDRDLPSRRNALWREVGPLPAIKEADHA